MGASNPTGFGDPTRCGERTRHIAASAWAWTTPTNGGDHVGCGDPTGCGEPVPFDDPMGLGDHRDCGVNMGGEHMALWDASTARAPPNPWLAASSWASAAPWIAGDPKAGHNAAARTRNAQPEGAVARMSHCRSKYVRRHCRMQRRPGGCPGGQAADLGSGSRGGDGGLMRYARRAASRGEAADVGGGEGNDAARGAVARN